MLFVQTGKIKNFPIVIMGTTYWKELIDFINKMAEFGMISRADINLIYATDSVEGAIAHIKSRAIEPFGLKLMTRVRRSLPWLGEHGLVDKLANRSRGYPFGYRNSAPRSPDSENVKKNK